jgi:hypothetical protein
MTRSKIDPTAASGGVNFLRGKAIADCILRIAELIVGRRGGGMKRKLSLA